MKRSNIPFCKAFDFYHSLDERVRSYGRVAFYYGVSCYTVAKWAQIERWQEEVRRIDGPPRTKFARPRSAAAVERGACRDVDTWLRELEASRERRALRRERARYRSRP